MYVVRMCEAISTYLVDLTYALAFCMIHIDKFVQFIVDKIDIAVFSVTQNRGCTKCTAPDEWNTSRVQFYI